MNIAAVQAFVETAERGSFAAVARARGVAPSTISRFVADLEDALEVRLFHRTTRRLSLTEAGIAYLGHVEPLLEELERAGEHARDVGASPRGRLRIAAARPFAHMHLTRWLPEFLGRYPDLEVELVLDMGFTDLVSERIDVAVRLGPLLPTTAIGKRLCAMPRVIVASPKYLGRRRRLPPRDLDGAPGLLFPYEGFAARWKLRDRNGELEEVQPKARVVASDGLMLRDLAVAGEGVALLPRWLCAEELASGSLVDVAPRYDVTATEFGAEIALLYPSRAYLPTKVRAFIDYVSELFRGGPPWEQTMR